MCSDYTRNIPHVRRPGVNTGKVWYDRRGHPGSTFFHIAPYAGPPVLARVPGRVADHLQVNNLRHVKLGWSSVWHRLEAQHGRKVATAAMQLCHDQGGHDTEAR